MPKRKLKNGKNLSKEEIEKQKKLAAQKRKQKKKRKKSRKKLLQQQESKIKESLSNSEELRKNSEVEIEFVSEKYEPSDFLAKTFKETFNKFTTAEKLFENLENNNDKNKNKDNELDNEDIKLDEIINDANNNNTQNRNNNNNNIINDEKNSNNNNNINKNNNTNNITNNSNTNEINCLSNKKRKEKLRPNISTLKQNVSRPDLVEEHDCNSPDPYFLIWLKSLPNTVPIPSHWSQKRKYLQGKRGFLKPPFKLPQYIEQTGITKIRETRLSILSDQSTKKIQRKKARPTTGNMVIDYKILHDAFKKYQTKPKMTKFGELYYEGCEYERRYNRHKPGYISDRLKKSLNMTPRYKVIDPNGAVVQERIENDSDGGDVTWKDKTTLKYGTIIIWDENYGKHKIRISAPIYGYVYLKNKQGDSILKRIDIDDPPPWLINMQRFGPPASYPDLKIAGLNSPIPPGKMYGFHEGQWGKPPVNENGEPLYGDPFGIWTEPISKSSLSKLRWGVITNLQESSSDEESSSDDDDESSSSDDDNNNNININNINNNNIKNIQINNNNIINNNKKQSGILSTQSQLTSISGMTTPDAITLRKQQEGIDTPSSINSSLSELSLRKSNRELYQILQPKQNKISGRFGSDYIYQNIVSLNPNELEKLNKDKNLLKRKLSELNNQNNNEPPNKKRRLNDNISTSNDDDDDDDDDDNDPMRNIRF